MWPESWIVNWEPRLQYERNYDFNGVLQDEGIQGRLGFQFAKNISFYTNVNRDMERYRDVDFWKSRYSFGWTVNTSRRISINGSTWTGDQIRFVDNPYLGSDRQFNLLINVRPLSRLQSEININTSRFVDVRSDTEVFDVKIFRTRTTYQFTNRLRPPQHPGVQHLRQDGRRQRAPHLPRQRRHRVLRGLRRSLPAGPKHR